MGQDRITTRHSIASQQDTHQVSPPVGGTAAAEPAALMLPVNSCLCAAAKAVARCSSSYILLRSSLTRPPCST